MLRYGVVAAVLVCAGTLLAGQHHASAQERVQHTCGLTDREFLDDYQVQITYVKMAGDDYLSGTEKAADVISAARDAAATVRRGRPLDPSLRLVQKYARTMFLQYAVAIDARAAGGSAAREMYLASMIGSRLDDVLRAAKPGLAAKGCDVADVLE